eukprot:scaffold5639_cov141-Skeletonema_marinoi.AAC.6
MSQPASARLLISSFGFHRIRSEYLAVETKGRMYCHSLYDSTGFMAALLSTQTSKKIRSTKQNRIDEAINKEDK